MLDSISGKQSPIHGSDLNGVGAQQSSQSVEKVNVQSAKDSASVKSLDQFLDEAIISPEAKVAYEKEKASLQFARLAQRIKEPYNGETVGQMKNLLDSGRINEYLRTVNTDTLAQNILQSASGKFLR